MLPGAGAGAGARARAVRKFEEDLFMQWVGSLGGLLQETLNPTVYKFFNF